MNTATSLPIRLLAVLYIAIGGAGLVSHFPRPLATASLEDLWIEGTELVAVIAGIFMLRRHNWARWVALAWIAFHLVISFGAPGEAIMHGLLLVLFAWILLRPAAGQYFSRPAPRFS